jgi:hypothetical protein
MSRVLVGFEAVQVREGEDLLDGYLEVGEDGVVRFAQTGGPESSRPAGDQPAEAVKGSLGEFEEVEQPVEIE